MQVSFETALGVHGVLDTGFVRTREAVALYVEFDRWETGLLDDERCL